MFLPGSLTTVIHGIGTINMVSAIQPYFDVVFYSKSCEHLLYHFQFGGKLAIRSMPTWEDVDAGIELVEEAVSVDKSVLAFGGGSVIDVAKIVTRDANAKILIAAPTISGSGSEVTRYAVLWDKKNKKKISFSGNELFPHLAVVDPSIQLDVPVGQVAYSMLDTFSHAYEAYFHKDATSTVKNFSASAVSILSTRFTQILHTRTGVDGMSLKSMLSTASLFAASAMSQTSTHMCHSISYPLTTRFGVPHGLAAFITVPHLLKICSAETLNGEFGVYRELDFFKIKYRLSEFGVKYEDIYDIVEEAFDYGKMDRCVVKVTKDGLIEALKERL